MASIDPALAVRAGAAAATVGDGAPSREQADLQQEGRQQQAQRQKREKRPKPSPVRPTHFLALQVSQHPGVAAAIATVQASLRRHSPHLKKACVEAASAHLTLGVMALHSKDEQGRAMDVLAALAEPLHQGELLAPVQVQLGGLSHFGNQVLFLDVRPDGGLKQLAALAAAARAHFKDAGLLLQADQAFVPHVTIAKTSKLQGWGKRGRGGGGGKGHIDAEAWAQHANIVGGSVLLGELQLCAMQGRKPEEYYPVLSALPLAPSETAVAAAAQPAGKGSAGQAAAAEAVPVVVDIAAANSYKVFKAAAELPEGLEDVGPAKQPAAAPPSATHTTAVVP